MNRNENKDDRGAGHHAGRGRRGGRRGGGFGRGGGTKRPSPPGTTPEKAKEPKWAEDIFGPFDNSMNTAINFINEEPDSDMELSELSEFESDNEVEEINDVNNNEKVVQEERNIDEENYKRLEKLGNLVVNTLINKIDKAELKYFTFLEEVNEIDEILKICIFENLKLFYIPYMARNEINRLNGPTNRNVGSNVDKNNNGIRFRNDERGREWLFENKVKGSRKRFSKPQELTHSISVVIMNTTKDNEIFLDVIGKSLNNCYEGNKETFVMVEHQNLCRLIVHLNEELFNNMKQIMTKETNIFLEHFPSKFRSVSNETNSYAIAFMSTLRYNAFIYNSINNYIGVTFRFYGSLRKLLSNEKIFVYIKKVVTKRRTFYICIPADKLTKEKMIRGIKEDYIEPFVPINVMKDVNNMLGRKVKFIEVCSKEYMCEGGCSQFNRGARESRCNSGKLHIEDEDLRKELYRLCKKGLDIDENWIPKNKPHEGPSYSNKVYKMESSRNYLKALKQPKKIETIMLTDEDKLLRIQKFIGKNSDEVKVELQTLIKHEKIVQLIQKVELHGEKINARGESIFGALLFKSEHDAINFKSFWDTYKVLTDQKIEIKKWSSIKNKINEIPSPRRKIRDVSALEKLEDRMNNMERQSKKNTEILERLDKVFEAKLDAIKMEFKKLLKDV